MRDRRGGPYALDGLGDDDARRRKDEQGLERCADVLELAVAVGMVGVSWARGETNRDELQTLNDYIDAGM